MVIAVSYFFDRSYGARMTICPSGPKPRYNPMTLSAVLGLESGFLGWGYPRGCPFKSSVLEGRPP